MKSISLTLFLILVIILGITLSQYWADVKEVTYGAFKITQELTLPGSPVIIYDAITGDISGWWDHTFSENPLHFFMEAKPGGRFFEQFDGEGNGVLHATVIAADRGKLLRFDGPLGLAGRAVKMVHTYQFSPVGEDSTRIQLTVSLSGEIEENLAKTVDRVWHHFLVERFKPYIIEGKHLVTPFEDNLKWGYKNNRGEIVIQAKYQMANEFNRFGIAAVVDDQGWVYINKQGKYLLRPHIIDNGPDYFNEGLARYVVDGKIGFMNEYGVKVIPATFDYVNPFSDGLAAFCQGCSKVSKGEYHRYEGGKWGYINKYGEIVVKPEYESAGPFQDGKAEVLREGQKIVLRKDDIVE